MDEITSILSSVMEDPEAMERIKQTAQELFSGGGFSSPQPQQQEKKKSADLFDGMGDILPIITKIAPLLRSMEGEDDNVRLLHALRPFLGDERKKRIDEAEKLMQIIRLLPILRGQNIL